MICRGELCSPGKPENRFFVTGPPKPAGGETPPLQSYRMFRENCRGRRPRRPTELRSIQDTGRPEAVPYNPDRKIDVVGAGSPGPG